MNWKAVTSVYLYLQAVPLLLFAEVLAVLLLLALYRERSSLRQRPFVRKYEFSLEEFGRPSHSRLLLVSVLGLFLELMMIRWISSEIRIFAFFKNFILIACFFGFGLGCYLCRKRINLLASMLPLLFLAMLIELPIRPLRSLVSSLPAMIGATSEVNMWGVPSVPTNWLSLTLLALAVILLIPLFALMAFAFVPVGQMIGWYLERASNGILAYTVNVVGSLLGIVFYTALCFFYTPPAAWFAAAGILLALLVWRKSVLRWSTLAVFGACVVLLLLPRNPGTSVYWSAYQKLGVSPVVWDKALVAYQLNTNDSWYQEIFNLSPQFLRAHPALLGGYPAEWNPYNVPYQFYPAPPQVLVLGSGMGNDVAAALRNGAGSVVAVEIDPLILQLGRRLHFEHPYQSPRVQTVLDDARSYIQTSQQQFDLIVFSLLDSHTTSSHYSNIRIDNYVYTVEALTAARRRLKPDGVFIVKFQADTPWIAGRLELLLKTVFGVEPLQLQVYSPYSTGGRFFITGSQPRLAAALANPQVAQFARQHGNVVMQKASLTTDDWPYFYQHEPGIPLCVIVMSAALLLVCFGLLGSAGFSLGSLEWHFFFLGAAFLLLEVQIVSKMALLFGTTWIVNSLVIAGLLLLIVAANYLVEALGQIPYAWAYAGLFASMVVSYLVPLEKLFFASFWIKAVASTLVLCLPVFFAGIVFIRSFAASNCSGAALGSNLFGALLGGILESLSFWTGLKSLLLIAMGCYVASAVVLALRAPARRRLASLVESRV